MTFDATDDYVTCERCGCIRLLTVATCPRCAKVDALTAERFTP